MQPSESENLMWPNYTILWQLMLTVRERFDGVTSLLTTSELGENYLNNSSADA